MTAKSVIRITSSCSKLKWLGDLRDWNIGQRERQIIFKDIGCAASCMYGNWETREMEPKCSGADIVTALNDRFKSISKMYPAIQPPGVLME